MAKSRKQWQSILNETNSQIASEKKIMQKLERRREKAEKKISKLEAKERGVATGENLHNSEPLDRL